jgi:hypothetical protein
MPDRRGTQAEVDRFRVLIMFGPRPKAKGQRPKPKPEKPKK